MKKILISAAVLMICLSALWSSDSITIDKKDFQQVDWVSLYQTGKNVDVVTDEGTINSEIVLVDKDVYSYDAVWSWTYPNEVDEFTYRVNGGSWHTVDGDVFSVKTKRLNIGGFSVLDVYASKNGIDSTISSTGLIVQRVESPSKVLSFRLSLSPYSLAIFDFYNGHHLPSASYLGLSRYGFGGDIDLGYTVGDRVRISVGGGYSLVEKKNTIIPDAHEIQYIKAFGGLEAVVYRKNSFDISCGINAGVMMHINANRFNVSPIYGARFDFTKSFNDTIALSIGSKLTVAHLPAPDPLLCSMTYIVEPAVISIRTSF